MLMKDIFEHKKPVFLSATFLTLFAVLGGGLVAYSYQITFQRIKANERAALLQNINALIPKDKYDNDLFNDVIQIQHEALLGSEEPVMVYRARQQGKPVAVVLTVMALNGYNGPIKLLIGINYDGVIAGVRVISHQETPGLGDLIELRRSDWILSFKGRSLQNPTATGWKVKRDGGVFDQLTGATITPRAVVKAVHNTLLFFLQSRASLFASQNNDE